MLGSTCGYWGGRHGPLLGAFTIPVPWESYGHENWTQDGLPGWLARNLLSNPMATSIPNPGLEAQLTTPPGLDIISKALTDPLIISLKIRQYNYRAVSYTEQISYLNKYFQI